MLEVSLIKYAYDGSEHRLTIRRDRIRERIGREYRAQILRRWRERSRSPSEQGRRPSPSWTSLDLPGAATQERRWRPFDSPPPDTAVARSTAARRWRRDKEDARSRSTSPINTPLQQQPRRLEVAPEKRPEKRGLRDGLHPKSRPPVPPSGWAPLLTGPNAIPVASAIVPLSYAAEGEETESWQDAQEAEDGELWRYD